MKTRTVVHIALNAKNERVGNLVEAAGRLIPFKNNNTDSLKKRTASEWIELGFCSFPSIDYWKQYIKRSANAVRFQRVTLIGESK